MTTEKNAKFFKAKANQLQVAINKVKSVLERYAAETENMAYPHPAKYDDWNNYHDLQHRLEDRLRENFINFQDWHFVNFGWCAF